MYLRRFHWPIGIAALLLVTVMLWLSLDWIGNRVFQRGVRAKREWRLNDAIRAFSWARRLQRNKHAASFELGLTHQLRGDFLASQNELTTLATSGIDDKELLTRIHNAIGVNQFSFAEPDSALASHNRALEFARNAKNRRLEAAALIDLSRVLYHSKGQFYQARTNLELALTNGRELGDESIQAAALRNLGVIHWWFNGELDRPLREFYFPALELYRRQNDERGAATMLTLIALVFNNKGDIYRFMQYINESIEIQKRIGDQAGLSDSYKSLGILYNGIGNYRKAIELFSVGLTITKTTGYRLVQNELNILLADVHLNLDQYDDALKLYDPSLKHRETNPSLSHYQLQYIAHCYQLKGDHREALALFDKALKLHEKANTPDVRFRSNTLLRVAECAIASGDWDRASQAWSMTQNDFAHSEAHSEGAIRPALVQAKIARYEGRHGEALKAMQEALDAEARIFAAAKTNFLIPPHHRSYELLFNFLLEYAVGTQEPQLANTAIKLVFGFLENMRYRSLRNFLIHVNEGQFVSESEPERALTAEIKDLSERLKSENDARTRDRLRKAYSEYEELALKSQLNLPEYLAEASVKVATLTEVQEKLLTGTALVQFLFAGEQVFALVITQNDARVILLPVSRNELSAKTSLLRSLVSIKGQLQGDEENAWLPVAKSLGSSLIDTLGAAGLLKNITSLGIVPSSFLHNLPFAVLIYNNEFLIERYELFRVVSGTFYVQRIESQIPDRDRSRTAAFGRNKSGDNNLPDLRFAAEEAAAVAQTSGGRAFLDQQATETNLKQFSRNSTYLHLATHGVTESDMPLLSRLLLEPTSTDDGNLTVREIFALGLRTRLVILSGCDTGQSYSASGTSYAEQDRTGLIEAFLHAGSQNVIATLWPISDQSTTEFMNHFHQQLTTNNGIGTALAGTQRAMIRGEIGIEPQRTKFKHPRYWAPFILVGDAR
jgi:CHAT domain-containing protein